MAEGVQETLGQSSGSGCTDWKGVQIYFPHKENGVNRVQSPRGSEAVLSLWQFR